MKILLPIGLSFYVFQSMSYVIDVYKNKITPEHHFGIFALYVSFFPQLVAGPIERARNLIPQFYKKKEWCNEQFISGCKRIIWGLFKKVVIADRLAFFVDAIYANPGDHAGLTLILASYLFLIQIYCDFSGYCDIAVGAARILGFKLSENFNLPYLAPNIQEFWRRWHITLGTWVRDYVFIPLGGASKNLYKRNLSFLFSFFLIGLWHGASWNFVIWGVIHGIYLIVSRLKRSHYKATSLKYEKWSDALYFFRVLITFQLATFAAIFFRANSLTDAFIILKDILLTPFSITQLPTPSILILTIGFVLIEIFQQKAKRLNIIKYYFPKAPLFRYASYVATFFIIILIGVEQKNAFYYFQF